MHDLLFQGKLERASMNAGAQGLGLDLGALGSCLNKEGVARVRADMAIAEELGIQSTPYFLIGRIDEQGRLQPSNIVRGAKSFVDFANVLDPLVRQHDAARRGRAQPRPTSSPNEDHRLHRSPA